MSLPNVEKESTGEFRGNSRLTARLLSPEEPLFAEWLLARQKLVEDKGWNTPSGEYDRYDDNLRTKHLVLYDDTERLIFGMRLTPVESYNQTLSWEMVRPSNVHAQVELNGLIDPGQPVWDLTRLTPGKDVPYRLSSEAIPRLFGEGLRQCIVEGDDDPTWIFTLDEKMAHWLKRQEVNFIELVEAILPGDTDVSIFGSIKPAHLAELASRPHDGSKASDFAHRAMKDGEG